MATTNGNRKILDLKRWEFCNPAPVASAAGMCVAESTNAKQIAMYNTSNTVQYLYFPSEDSFIQVATASLAGTFGAGTAIVAAEWSTAGTGSAAFLTASAGTTSSISTNQTLARDLRGYYLLVMAGPNSGSTIAITSNTIGLNSVISVTPQPEAFSSATAFRLLTPRWYVVNAGSLAAGSFKAYDYATNTWLTLAQTGLPATITTDSRLIATSAWESASYVAYSVGTASAATTSTLTDSSKNWGVNQWSGSQVRLVRGTGAGQIRTVSSNTSTQLTLASNWVTTPDASSTYSIEGNDDFIYYIGSAAGAMYRYQISTNTWITLNPVVARAGTPGAGLSGHWIKRSNDAAWNNETNIISGRRIYSFRAGAAVNNPLDYYDIALNTWVTSSYAPFNETLTTGTKYVLVADQLYIHKDATGRWFKMNFVTSELEPWSTMTYTQGAAVAGDTAWISYYYDGPTVIPYVYMLLNTSNVLLRQMVI